MAIHGHEVRHPKRSTHDGNGEKGFLTKNGDAARNCADDRGPIGVAGVIGGKENGAAWNIFQAFDTRAHSGDAADPYNSSDSGVIQRIDVAGERNVEHKRRAHHDGDDR